MNSTTLLFTKASSTPGAVKTVNMTFSKSQIKWIPHPDTLVDLSILDLSTMPRKDTLFSRWIDERSIPHDSIWRTFTYYEQLLMFGYPNGLIDSYNNLPILRSGVTATQPKLNYNNREEFLTDIYNYGGSSGSPVFLHRKSLAAKFPKPGVTQLADSGSYYFVGIHYSGEYFDLKKSKIEMASVDDVTPDSTKVQVPLNIGHAIKSIKVLDFKKLLFK